MSILLEALRKSEKSQRSHEVPTIHTDDEAVAVSESLKTGPLAMLLIAALFICGWFVWQQYQVPASMNGSTVADSQAATEEPQAEIVEKEAPALIAPSATNVKTPSAQVDKTASKQRTPMESYKPPINRPPSSKPANAGQQPVTAPRQSTSTNASNTKPVEIVKPRPKPEKQELTPIGYWELPDAVRANVPETKFSVLVYADNPADRFVLINGQRLVEGDEAGSGLVVKEIRRDGVIFSYRLYQFLVDR